jgi:hypothetical protein
MRTEASVRKLGLGLGWSIAVIALAMAGCDDGGGGDEDSGVDLVDSGSMRDAGRTDAGGMRDAGSDAGGGGGGCGPAGDCELTDPTSCGSGMGCLLQPDGSDGLTTMCFTAGTGTDGTACDPTMAGQCAEGFGCSDDRFCREWCCSSTDCAPGQICNQFAGANGAGICAVPASCDLVAQTGCDEGEECNILDSATGALTCDPAGTATEGQSCAARNACVAGMTCIGDPGLCRAYCDMGAETPCPTDFMCAGLTGAPEGVGVCVPTTTT